MRVTPTLPQRERQPKGCIPLTPLYSPVVQKTGYQILIRVILGGYSSQEVEAMIAELSKNQNTPNASFMRGMNMI
jgi:hypothetical protein